MLTIAGRPARYASRPPGPPFNSAFMAGRPHRITITLRKTHGIHARTSTGRTIVAGTTAVPVRPRGDLPPGPVGAKLSCERSSGNTQTSRGFQTRQNHVRAPRESSPPTISTSSGPTKLLQAYWAIANTPPDTRTAGQTPTKPRHPLI